MLHRILKLLTPAVCAVLLIAVMPTVAEAKGRVGRVTGVARAGQDWSHARLKLRWHPVRGATSYQMRVAATRARLHHIHPGRSRTAAGKYTRVLQRNRVWFVQVRALRHHKKGRWSRVRAVRFVRPASGVVVHHDPVKHHPFSGTTFGMSVSPGTSFTNGARETASQQVSRITKTYGGLDVAKIFYSGNLPTTFNRNYEGLVPGKTVAVCFKPSQSALANGSLDSAITRYLDSIPAGWKVMLVNWQEPDDEMWKDHKFTVAQHRAATERLIHLVHSNPAYAQDRAEVWDVYMGFSIDSGRWQDSAASPDLDGIGWDYYWNTPTTSWASDPGEDLKRMANVTKRLGIEQYGLFETGDNPHPNDGAGRGRAAFWQKVYNSTASLGYRYVMYFNAIGTTGDHRIRPDTSFGGPTAAVLRSYM
jgi:hypothetical protein